MNLSQRSDLVLAPRRSGRRVAEQRLQQGSQVEPTIEPVGKRAEVVAGVLAELERLVRAVDHGFEVAQDRVDPVELRHLARLALADDHVAVRAACVDDAGKASQSVAEHVAGGQQVDLGPVRDGLAAERGDGRHLDAQGMPSIAAGDCCDEGHLVLGAAAGGARVLAAQVGVIELHQAVQGLLGVTHGHGRHQLVLNQPGRAVARTEVPHQRQRRQPRLVLADQEDGEEPGAQRQLGAVHQRAGRERGLAAARPALKQRSRPVFHDIVLGRVAARTAKAVRSAHRHQRRCTLFFGAVAREELRHRQAGLELDAVDGHGGWLLRGDRGQRRRQLAHGVSLAELGAESG
jgi:hypothetical protein